MSHYAVAVIHRGKQDIDDLLEPYCPTTHNPNR